jgi:hypothetical protein
MEQQITAVNNSDDQGRPIGGTVRGVGLSIDWQNGPLGRGEDRLAPNGAFVETVIRSALQRLEYYQATQFRCRENALAIIGLEDALRALKSRTKRRESDGTEGTYQGK